jgi:hypothetical protein
MYGQGTCIENGAISRTTCCELREPDLLGMRSGSKSGGKYLLRTGKIMSASHQSRRLAITRLCVPTCWSPSEGDELCHVRDTHSRPSSRTPNKTEGLSNHFWPCNSGNQGRLDQEACWIGHPRQKMSSYHPRLCQQHCRSRRRDSDYPYSNIVIHQTSR